MVVLLAMLNDIPIMMIAYDDAPFARRPVRWDMARVLTIAAVLGIFGVFSSFGSSGSRATISRLTCLRRSNRRSS